MSSLCVVLLSPVTAGNSGPNLPDATSMQEASVRMRTVSLAPVDVLLDVRAYLGTSVRLYMTFPQPPLNRDLLPASVSWETTGQLSAGSSVIGGRTLIFQGDIAQGEIQERFEFTLRAAELLLGGGLRLQLLFEADFDGVRSVVAGSGLDGRPVALEVYPRPAGLLGTLTDPRSGALPTGLSIQPAASGVRVEAAFQGKRIALAPEYSDLNGLTLNAGFASVLGRRLAFGLLATGGSTKKEWLLNAGWQLSRTNRVIFTAGQLYQFFDIPFASGTDAVPLRQDAGAVSYQLMVGRGVVQSLDVDGYFARGQSRWLEPLTVIYDDASKYEMYLDPRRIAGGHIHGLEARAVLAPWPSGTIRINLGAERLAYDYLAGPEVRTFATEGVHVNQRVGLFNLSAGADSFASQRIYSLGAGPRLFGGGHQTSLTFTAVRGREGLPDDNQLRLTYSFGFGGSQSPAAAGPVGQRNDSELASPAFGLLSQVFTRPSFIPAQIVARLDATAGPRRLIVVEKTELPAGTVVDHATGAVTVPTPTAGIVEITRDALPFTNTGQFSFGPEGLVIHPSEMEAPPAGSLSTYVVTIQEGPDVTREVTAVVAPGSVRVISVTIGEPIDTLPDDFGFQQQANVPRSALVVSNPITVAGITVPISISISGGEYSIDGGNYTLAAGTVTNGRTVNVRLTSSASFSTSTSAALTIGPVSASFTVTTLPEDTTPNAFGFRAQANAALSTLVTSNTVTISGVNTVTGISVTGGEYSINRGSYRSTAGTITDGQTVSVRHTSAPTPNTATTTTLTVGGIKGTFTSTTLGPDTTPDGFSFTAQTNVALSTLITSNTVTISGINTAAAVSVSGGEYSINGGSYTSAAGTITSGQAVSVRQTSSANFSTAASATLTIGSASATFTVTTLPADTTPDDFNFTAQMGVARSTAVTSNTVTISGINTATAISISGSPGSTARYSIGGGSFTAGNSTINNNQTVQIRLTSSNALATTATATLTVGGISKVFSVTTENADTTPDVFSFTSQTNVAPSTLLTSNSITVSGINSPAAISIAGAGGEYLTGGGNNWRSTVGTVSNGDTVQVRQTSSSSFNTTTTTTLTIGGVSGAFSVTTQAQDICPDPFSFANKTDQLTNKTITSDTITVSGINSATAISISGAPGSEYNIGPGNNWTSAAGTVINGDSVKVRHTSSSSNNTTVTTTLTIGSAPCAQSASFSSTTRP